MMKIISGVVRLLRNAERVGGVKRFVTHHIKFIFLFSEQNLLWMTGGLNGHFLRYIVRE